MATLLMGVLAQAQVVINLQLPPLGLTIKPQLWNLSLVNTTPGDMEVRVEMVMTDVSNNQRVLTGTSRLFMLPRGARQLRVTDVMPVIYNPGSAGYAVDANPDGFLPVGLFSICYTVIRITGGDAVETLAETCETLEIEPLSPPQLIIPLDNESVDYTRPLFAWVPPAPLNSFYQLSYDWVLVEVQPTQTAADAIQQNIPVLTRQQIVYTSFQYPLASPELDTSKLYAWRVTAKSNTAVVANSEVWTFKVNKYEQGTYANTESGYFGKLSKTEDAAFILCSGVLRFEYLNDYNSNTVQLKLFDISSATRKELQLETPGKLINAGQNFVQLDLREQGGMVNQHMYLLELTDFKNEKWYLRFEYRK